MISNRKLEHLLICENFNVQYKNKKTGFNDIDFIHNSLPEVDMEKIDLSTEKFGKKLDIPLFITALTGGHPKSASINKQLAIVAESEKIGFGLGSQRAAIKNSELEYTYNIARENAPSTILIGNIGASQINYSMKAIELLDADILAIHLNPLQEAIQIEGDLDSKGILDSIGEIVDNVDVPVMVKETGAGISAEDSKLLESKNVDFIDIAGAGGTSWAGVETYRLEDKYLGELFWDWGIPTAVSTVEVSNSISIPIVSSGGIRSGLDAAKAIALGADAVGMALPFLKKVRIGSDAVINFIQNFKKSLRLAMFLVGASNIEELKKSNLIIKGETKSWLNERGFNTKKYTRRNII
ncbi:MAG: type 2 isopentenyl-diphosphate Delta-isomerase [Methanobrevibacter sp.]|jgi:isopentenyl-diphosphate delta-isomerase|nr:type 2 isopentenyl-diphosphate Delta-isomerase [Candidatus Methanovirga basalitermitum]